MSVASAVAAKPEPPSPATSGVIQMPAVRVLDRREVEQIPDDRDNLQPNDATILIVEDEPHYCRVLIDLAHTSGFKVLVATRGLDALALARQYHPSAISLDIFLPDVLGWTVLSQLKQGPATRHIPVQIVTLDEDRQLGLAVERLASSPSPPPRRDCKRLFRGSRNTPCRAAAAF